MKKQLYSIWIGLLFFVALAGCVTTTPNPNETGTTQIRTLKSFLYPQNLSAGDLYTPELGNTGYDVQHYTLKMDLTPGHRSLNGEVMIEAIITLDELKQISLDFIGFDISTVLVNGISASFFRDQNKLVIDLPEPFSANQAFSITICYHGTPSKKRSKYESYSDFPGLQSTGDYQFVASEPDGARYWFPCNDHPRDKATYRFELTVPKGYTGIANGTLVEAQTGSAPDHPESGVTDFYVWEHRFPMATYLATVLSGKYLRVESITPKGILLRHYLLEKHLKDFEKNSACVSEALDWMSDKFGAYPFEEFGYTLIKAQKRWALETQTNVLVDQDFIREKTLVHEMAHMWFGDWVSLNSWQEIWRNEGFATYIQLLWQYRTNPADLDKEMDPDIKSPSKGFFSLGNPPYKFLFDSSVYDRGALFVHALRKTMGDEAFYKGLRLYFERYGGRTATDAEFQAVMEEAAQMPLQDLFNKWLH